MPRFFVVPVNPKSLKVLSTDTHICLGVMYILLCCFENSTNRIYFIADTAV